MVFRRVSVFHLVFCIEEGLVYLMGLQSSPLRQLLDVATVLPGTELVTLRKVDVSWNGQKGCNVTL